MHAVVRGSSAWTTWLEAWQLIVDGQPIHTHSSDLLPVRTRDGLPAILKVPREEHERRGGVLMRWWAGKGAAHVLAAGHDGALLLECAMGRDSLATWTRSGRDEEATQVLCEALQRLHAPREQPWPCGLLPLGAWFVELEAIAGTHGGTLAAAHRIAQALLAEPREVMPLHGDLHHDNVLDFGTGRGWLAIDPKSLLGERGFDYANIFSNPQPPGVVTSDVALQPGVFERRLRIVTQMSGLDETRLLQWIAAYSGLSAAWIIGDGDDASLDLAIAARALGLLHAPAWRGI